MNIDVYSCFTHGSSLYAEALYKNLEQLKSGNHQIRYIGMYAVADKNIALPEHWICRPIATAFIEPNLDQPSVRHAKLLNQIAKNLLSDSDITIIIDCDMYVFMSEWDKFIVQQLKQYDCVGTPKHDRVLHMYFMAMETAKYKRCAFNFMPGEGLTDYVCRWKTIKASAKNFQIRPGTSIVTDTGWRISDQLSKAGMKYLKWNYSESNGAVPYRYYIITDRATLFCAHFGGSHKREFNGDQCQRWYVDCETLINK